MPQAAFPLRISPKAVLTYLTLGVLFAVLPASMAQGRLFNGYDNDNDDDYRVCVTDLIGNDSIADDLDDGLAPNVSAAACARALHPKKLSACVVDISNATAISPLDALKSCVRVRRPDDFAACTIVIDAGLEGVKPLDALDYCRRSLLPENYADCVLGFATAVDFSAIALLDVCINAGYKPTDLAPTFIPLEPGQDSFSGL